MTSAHDLILVIVINTFALSILFGQYRKASALKSNAWTGLHFNSSATVAYILLGLSTTVFFKTWLSVFSIYLIPKSLPLSLGLGTLFATMLATIIKKPNLYHLRTQTSKKLASIHILYALEALTLNGAYLTLFSDDMQLLTNYQVIILGGLIGLIPHWRHGSWKNCFIHTLYNVSWITLCLFLLDISGTLVAVGVSFAILKTLQHKELLFAKNR